MDSEDDLPLLTRREAIAFIRKELGVPVTKSTLDKKSMQGEGPPIRAYYGKRQLYSRVDLREWAMSLVTDKPAHLRAT
jgi:hypothetical protein